MAYGVTARLVRAAALCGVAAVAAWGTPAAAQPVPARAAICAACHGADGNSALAQSPSLAGQPRLFLENQMIMIREGLRDIPNMRGLLKDFSDADIVAVARHFSAQPLKPEPAAAQPERVARGAEISKGMFCGSCHLPDYKGREQMPRLAGQREDFLLHSMRELRDGKATGRDTIMAASLRGLTDEDLKDLAHYFAQMR